MGTAMASPSHNSSHLVRLAAAGDATARDVLFAEHRMRLKRMVRLRLHPRLQARIDESDVVQDVLLEAARCLPEYASHPPLPFFLWLRRITLHKLIDLHRRHLGAARRDARVEVPIQGSLPAATSAALAAQLLGGLTSPSGACAKKERQRLVQDALQGMDAIDREVLALRHFERLSNAEAAHVLEISESACSNRYVRALARLKVILKDVPGLA
jgi:RNA polymerase sigma-70 factor (ECF subfamily)